MVFSLKVGKGPGGNVFVIGKSRGSERCEEGIVQIVSTNFPANYFRSSD